MKFNPSYSAFLGLVISWWSWSCDPCDEPADPSRDPCDANLNGTAVVPVEQWREAADACRSGLRVPGDKESGVAVEFDTFLLNIRGEGGVSSLDSRSLKKKNVSLKITIICLWINRASVKY